MKKTEKLLVRYLLILLLLIGCSTSELRRERSPSSLRPMSCRKLVEQIAFAKKYRTEAIGLDMLPRKHYVDFYTLANHLENQGIDYQIVKSLENEDVFGIELLPTDSSRANKYTKRVSAKFDNVRVFYLTDIGPNAKGSYHYDTNIVKLGKMFLEKLVRIIQKLHYLMSLGMLGSLLERIEGLVVPIRESFALYPVT